MKNGNLYQEVKSAKRDNNIAWARKNEIELEMEKELEEATRPIIEKYEPILYKLEKEACIKTGKLCSVAGEYHDYASFFVRDITDLFAVLISYIEGQKFIPYRNFENREITEGSIIIKEDVYKQYDKIDYETLYRLYNNGDLIMLDSGISNMVDFYNYSGEPNYKFGKFNYLYEFTNRLIKHRIDNDIKIISFEEIYSFMCNFILTHHDLAMKNKDKREQMLVVQDGDEAYKKLEKKLKR